MLSEAIRAQYLCDELQCPGQLNQLVSSGQRAEFHLLLNMLCQDVSQQPQFALGSLEEKQLTARPASKDMRQQFDLPAKPPLSADKYASEYGCGLNNLLAEEGAVAVQLALSQYPEALASHNNTKFIQPEVFQLLEPVSQLRYLEKYPKPLDKPEPVTMYQVLSQFDYDKEIKVTHYS